jgi:hypothetical protein
VGAGGGSDASGGGGGGVRHFPHPSLADTYATVFAGKITKLPNQNWHLKQVRSTINKLLQPGSHELKVMLLYSETTWQTDGSS